MALCGGKSVGKSTLLRVLVNTLLDNQRSANSNNKGILVIDLDPGQAEFTAPGVMSAVLVKSPLLGPGYTQHLSPDR
jgi:polynucleotide 5'-hydroxyl-kinase GRC3/NOL9